MYKDDMNKEYSTPSIQLLGTLKELTANNRGNNNGCKQGGGGKEKTFTATDGFGNGQTGCAVS